MRPEVKYVKGYSIALLCTGLFLLLAAVQFSVEFRGTESDPVFAFIAGVLCLLGIPCLVVSLLRWMRVAAALTATTALSVCLLFAFPFGTFLALYWLKNVRPQEFPPQDPAYRAWFNYTVALYILGLLMLDMALVFRWVQSMPEPESNLFGIFALGGLIVALAAIATGAARSIPSTWAHSATFALNSLLLVLFPLGTALALTWFFAVRKHERTILREGRQELA